MEGVALGEGLEDVRVIDQDINIASVFFYNFRGCCNRSRICDIALDRDDHAWVDLSCSILESLKTPAKNINFECSGIGQGRCKSKPNA